MNSIFLRIYGGMLAALVLVALLGAATLHLVNEARGEQYRERLARGTFRLMADNLRPMSEVERRRALALWGRLLGIPLALRAPAGEPLDGRQRARLGQGQVLVEQTGPHAARIYGQVDDDGTLLTGEVRQVSEQLARATVYLLIDELVRYPADEQPRRLAALKRDKRFGFELSLARLEEADLDADQRRRVDEGDTVMALSKRGDAIRVFAGVAGTPWVLEIGPLYQMNPYPPRLLVLIGVLGLSLIGLTLYLLVRRLERRLNALERAASELANGRLEARAPADGADSVGRLASAFNVMAEHLQRSLGIQREMVRAVSHELRTPVARLRFGLEMLAEAKTATARRKYLDGMDHDIQDLDKLVDEMLTYARLEQGAPALEFHLLDPGALLDQVIAELAPLRPAVRLTREPVRAIPAPGEATPGEAALVEGAPRYLHRALQNLVSNALRYADSQVRLRVRIEDGRCRIDVDDDGPGVPESAWERVFSPFLRLDDSRTRASGGHGLGLSIVRRIVYWHGGRALVGRSDLGGARFSLVWPSRRDT